MITGHGGNIEALASRLGCSASEIIDMSCNLNPLGPPPGLEDFIKNNIRCIRSLPRADAGEMVRVFSRRCGLDSARVAAGNGTTWFIYTLPGALASKKVLILGPTYSDYRDGCIMHGIDYTYLMAGKETGFAPDMERLARLLSDKGHGIDTVVICNPNNPTGALVTREEILDLVEGHPEVRFLVDESYLPFVTGAEEISLVGESRYPNLLVLSSMSKIFRIPGLRTGFLCAHPKIIERVMASYQPWSVNSLAQAAIVHLLQNESQLEPFIQETRSYILREKELFVESLAGLSGLILYPGATYFILAELSGGGDASEVCEKVGEHKILIRDCTNFDGLSSSYVRFSLKKREENMELVRAIKSLGDLQ